MKIKTLLAIAIMGFTTLSANAAIHDPLVNKKQHNQHRRIAQGVKSGEVTRTEAKGLRQEQRALRTEERAYKADGKLDKTERSDLRQDQKEASRDIYQAKHNNVTRGQ